MITLLQNRWIAHVGLMCLYVMLYFSLPVYAATIYVGNQESNSLSVIDSTTKEVTHTIPLSSKKPHNLVASLDGKYLYIANVGSHNVVVFDTKTNREVVSIPAGTKTHGVSVTPDGQYLYTANVGENTVSVISLAEQKVIETIPVGK